MRMIKNERIIPRAIVIPVSLNIIRKYDTCTYL